MFHKIIILNFTKEIKKINVKDDFFLNFCWTFSVYSFSFLWKLLFCLWFWFVRCFRFLWNLFLGWFVMNLCWFYWFRSSSFSWICWLVNCVFIFLILSLFFRRFFPITSWLSSFRFCFTFTSSLRFLSFLFIFLFS